VLTNNNIHPKYHGHPRESNKAMKEALGVSPKRFISMWNAATVRAAIPEVIYDITKKTCKGGGGRYNKVALKEFTSKGEVVIQMLNDGQKNLVPFLIITGVNNVQDMKRMLGKACWKAVCKNSFSRNRLMAWRFGKPRMPFGDGHSMDWIKAQIALPTTLLADFSRVYSPLAVQVIKSERKLGNKDRRRYVNDIISDCIRMQPELSQRKDLHKYTMKTWEGLHHKGVEAIKLKKHPDTFISWLKPYDVKYSFGEFTATLLTSMRDIGYEGEDMKHCVGSYARSSSDGRCMIWSVRKNGDKYSTLSLNTNNRRIIVGQHYKKCNHTVDEEGAKKVATLAFEESRKIHHKIYPRRMEDGTM